MIFDFDCVSVGELEPVLASNDRIRTTVRIRNGSNDTETVIAAHLAFSFGGSIASSQNQNQTS